MGSDLLKGVKRISGSKKHLFWLVVVLALIIFGVVLYQFDTFVFEDAPNIAGKLKSNLNREGMNKILYNLDEINPFRFKKNILDGSLPIYELKLSSGDIKHFEELS